MSLADNALLTAHRFGGMVRRGLVSARAASGYADQCIRDNDVRCGGPGAAAQSLSGGNLQKYIVGRELRQAPRLVVVGQPTWGVDVAAAALIRQQLIDLAAQGAAVLVISEELGEILEICDRVAVIAGGRLSPAKPVAETDAQGVTHHSNYPVWFEDVDYCRRLVSDGGTIWFQPSVRVFHHGGHSVQKIELGYRQRVWYGSLLRYAAKHFRPVSRRVLAVTVGVAIVPRVLFARAGESFGTRLENIKFIWRLAWTCFQTGGSTEDRPERNA